ncbi:MAG: succinate dehydrogenase, cytochrome b556 subunit [Gammaproteobacteria bacterium]|nr:succinate dehydrogenase, cytochrome b556 subunit [Gammaproteobacteria bacterium]
MSHDNRPKYLNLFKIKLPIAGMISIFHRLTGVLLFLAIPVSLYLLQLSITDGPSFQSVVSLMLEPISRFFILLVIWSFVHHLLTGVRFLLIDMELFLEKEAAKISAWGVVVAETVVMLVIIKGLFL